MWKTIEEAEAWEDYIIIWYNKFKERQLLFGGNEDLTQYHDMETDHGKFRVKFMETQTKVCNYRFTRAGRRLEEDELESDVNNYTLEDSVYMVRCCIEMDYKELVKFNHLCFIPSNVNFLKISNYENDDRENNSYVGLAFLGTTLFCFPNGLCLTDLIDLSSYTENLQEQLYHKLVLDKCSILNASNILEECYVKEYRTTYEGLMSSQNANFVECCKLLIIENYNEAVKETYRLKNMLLRVKMTLSHLHAGTADGRDVCKNPFILTSLVKKIKLNNAYTGDYSEDYVYAYLRQDMFVDLECNLDEVLSDLSACLGVDKGMFDLTHMKDNVLLIKLFGGLNVQLILTNLTSQELYAMLMDFSIRRDLDE